jgi:hypothetical protein
MRCFRPVLARGNLRITCLTGLGAEIAKLEGARDRRESLIEKVEVAHGTEEKV